MLRCAYIDRFVHYLIFLFSGMTRKRSRKQVYPIYMVPSKNFQSGLTDNSQIEEETQERTDGRDRLISYCNLLLSILFFPLLSLHCAHSTLIESAKLFVRLNIYAYQRMRHDVKPRDTYCAKIQLNAFLEIKLEFFFVFIFK